MNGRFERCLLVAALFAAAACASASSAPGPSPTPGPQTTPVRILLLTATTGFRHESIAAAGTTFQELAATGEFTVSATEDVASITAARLNDIDVLVFGLTTGELPFDAAQKAAILAFVNRGGGYAGFHSATDTLYTWAEYGALVGAYFKDHPWTQVGTVTVEDRTHPAAAGLSSFAIQEEFYTFRENPRGRVQVLMSLDAASVGATGDYPLAWTQVVGNGRAYYNALGHFPATWTDVRFRAQLRAALLWLARR